MIDYLDLAQQAFDSSTTYIDSNYRRDWEYSLKTFRMEHASGSKYLSDEYKSRSRLISSKTRSIVRKNEAAAMQAAFSNNEIVSCEPGNPNNVTSVASAAALKEILEYRLTKTIPTFETYLGGVQDAQTVGAVCSYQYWEYEQREGKKLKDKPCIELRPVENIRFDSGASWLDPVNSSPYFCDIIPMYVCDVRAMMKNIDDKTGAPKWKKFEDSVILKATPEIIDTTRRARLGDKQDPEQENKEIKSFDIVWVMRWFMRENGEDMTYYTLGTEELLTDVKPLDEVYFHGKRPYVIGYAILETHKTFKTSMPMLVRNIQLESTEIRNQRLDNVKFVLNKRWLVARGRQVDVQSLVRNVPGGVTLTNDPKNDIVESNWSDVTSSAFVEHDRLNAEFDDLAGNFSPSTKVANNAVNDTLGGSRMAAAGAGLMTEYLIHTINMTWWQPVLRQLALLEQYYETDEVVLAVCAEKAKLYPRFGISNITDMMLMNEVTVSVDMAMGEPNQRLQKFIAATTAAIQLRQTQAPGANINEMTKEIYANAGYRDGTRFFSDQQDPQLMKAMQVIQQLHGQLQGKQMELQASGQIEQFKVQSAEKQKMAQLQVDQGRITGDLQLRDRELSLKEVELQIKAAEAHGKLTQTEPPVNPLMEQAEIADKMAHVDLQVAQADKARKEADVAVQTAISGIVKTSAETAAIAAPVNDQQAGLEDIKTGLQSTYDAMREIFDQHATRTTEDIGKLGQGLQSLASQVTNKKKPSGFVLKKGLDSKTKSVIVNYSDGSTDEMPVQ